MKNNGTGDCCYGIGEYVVYRSGGIYRIDDIRKEDFFGIGTKTYYVLVSVYDDNSMVYVPVDAKDLDRCLRPTLSADEINELIARAALELDIWEWPDDVKVRANLYDGLLSDGKCCDILRIYLTLQKYRDELEGGKKKLYASDAKLLAASEKILTDEFSFVLGIEKSDVSEYINESIKKHRRDAV